LSLFVDTSVWSLALRRDRPPDVPEVARLQQALESGETLVSTGLVLQELLQGFAGPRNRQEIINRFLALTFISPDRQDHVAAAELRTELRRRGVQVGTVDVLLAQICLRRELTMLTTDKDFRHVAVHTDLKVWA
jgi:predicted nucleic acid-binding protein